MSYLRYQMKLRKYKQGKQDILHYDIRKSVNWDSSDRRGSAFRLGVVGATAGFSLNKTQYDVDLHNLISTDISFSDRYNIEDGYNWAVSRGLRRRP